MKTDIKRAAIYIRVSTVDQAREGYSLEAQETALRNYCAEHKYEIFDLYADRGISGKDVTHRPDMGRLMRDARGDKFDIVVFWALSRFTRSVSDLYHTMEVFQEHDIYMASYTESFFTASPMGRAMIGIVGVFAQLERELTGERVSAALATRAAQGKCTAATILGYTYHNGTLVLCEQEAVRVRFYFENYLIYKNLTELAMVARERGYRGKRGKLASASSIRAILTCPVYCGYHVFKGQLHKGTHKLIVSVDLFNKVQRLLKKQGKLSGRTARTQIRYISQ